MPSPVCDVGLKGGIITGGLGRPACMGIITVLPFQLACFKFIPPPPPPTPIDKATAGQGGGVIPLEPGEIHDFYQPVDVDGLEGTLADPSVYGKRMVKLKFTSRFFEGEKEFMLSERHGKYAIKAANIVNSTMEGMKVTAKNIRHIATDGIIKIKKVIWRTKP